MAQPADKFGKPLTFYKQSIDLFDFMLLFGFEQSAGDKAKSSRNHRCLSNPHTGERYVIKQNASNEFTFYSPHDSSVRGSSIIDFVQNHYRHVNPGENFHLGKVRKVLDDYIAGKLTAGNIPELVSASHAQGRGVVRKISDSVPQDVLDEIYGVRSLFNTRFLTEARHLDIDTINSPPFVNRVFNSVYQHENQTIINTAFLFINRQDEVCGLSVRNKTPEKSYKRIFEGKNGLVCSNNLSVKIESKVEDNKSFSVISSDSSGNPPVFIICESFIDAMSHYELNKEELANKNIRYLSTEGTPSEAQISLFDQLVAHARPAGLQLAFDNDRAGNMFATMFLCNLSNETIGHFSDNAHASSFFTGLVLPGDASFKAELLTSFDKDRRAENFGQLTISFSTGNKAESSELGAQINQAFNAFNSSHVVEHGEKNSFAIAFKELDRQNRIEVTFKNNRECWDSACKLVLQFKYHNTSHITRVKSVLNDFNEDLSLKKGKHPRYVLKMHNGEQALVMRDNPGKSPDISPGNKLNI
jgi:hypothetical protein